MKMERALIFASIAVAAFLLSSAAGFNNTTIKGFISPSQGALEVWAISPDETVRGDVANGSFELDGIKQGTYAIKVQAVAPYISAVKEGIRVEDGAQVNLGEIKLEKVSPLATVPLNK